MVSKMHFNNTGNCKPQKSVFFACFFLCCLFAAVLLAPVGIGLAAEYGQAEDAGKVIDRPDQPTVLYSLQVNTYVYESAATRAYGALPGDLQSDGFVYKTDSGYYTLRFGLAAGRDDLRSIEAKLAGEGYSYIKVRTDPNKLNIATGEMLQTAEPEMEKPLPAAQLSEDVPADWPDLPPVLYSLQVNTYVYESAAMRAHDALPGDLQSDGFVYRTDSGYYTLRFGLAAGRDDLKSTEAKLAGKGYSYTKVRTDPNKLNIATGEMLQTAEPARDAMPEAEAAEPAKETYVADAETEKQPAATKQKETPAAGILGKDRGETMSGTSLYQDDMAAPHVLPTDGNYLNLSLEDAIRMAIDWNSDIKIASFLSPIAEEQKKSTHTVYDPSLFAESNISRTDRPIQSKLDLGEGDTESDNFVEDKWDMRGGIKQPLPTGGTFSLTVLDVDHLDSSSDIVIPNPQYTSRLTLELRQALLKELGDQTNRSAMEIADLNLSISGMEFRKTLANVMREVGTYYWRLVYYAKQISISRKYLQDAEDIYKKLLYRKESGLADLLDVDRALASVHDRKAIFIKANTEYKLAIDQLKLLLGFAHKSEKADVAIIATEKLTSKPVSLDKSALQEEALLNRPVQIIAEDRVSAVEIQKKLAKHLRLPTLDAKAMYAFNALGEDFGDDVGDTYFSDEGSWAIGLEFVWPIGGRKAEADYLKVIYEEKQSQEELEKTSREVIFQINSSVTEIEQSLKEIEATRNSKEANQRLLAREKSRFEVRQVNIHSLLDAQDDYYIAYRTYIKAITNYNISLLKLKWAKGTILEDYGVMQQN
jgi:outer membrane protein TolC